jgi:hypothetical protein
MKRFFYTLLLLLTVVWQFAAAQTVPGDIAASCTVGIEPTATSVCPGAAVGLAAIVGCDGATFSIDAFASATYEVNEFDLEGVAYPGNPFVVGVTLDAGNPNTLVIDNLGDWEGEPAFLVFNPDPLNPTIQVLETENGYTQAGVPLLWTGEGFYDVCTGEFTVLYAFKNPETQAILVPAVNIFTPEGGTISFEWSNGSTASFITIAPEETTTYTVKISGDGGCEAEASVTIEVKTPPTAPVASSNSPVVAGSSIELSATDVSNATYSWIGPNGFTSDEQNPVIGNATLDNAGAYAVVVTDIDSECVSEASTVQIFVVDGGVCDAEISASVTSICEGESVVLTAESICTISELQLSVFTDTEYEVNEFDPQGVPYEENPIEVGIFIDADTVNTLVILNLGDWDGEPAFLVLNPDVNNPTITIKETLNGYAQAGVPLLWTGTGTYDICAKSFVVDYAFKNSNTGEILVPAKNVFTPVGISDPIFTWSNGESTSSITVSPETTTTYTVTIVNSDGCAAIASQQIEVKATAATEQEPTICSGETFTVGANNYTESGTYIDTLAGINGCDSIVTTVLTVNPSYSINQSFSICEGDSVVVGSSVYFEAGVFVDSFTTVQGCDSVYTTSISVLGSDPIEIARTICEGDSVVIGDTAYFDSGVYINTFVSAGGCDSIVELTLTVLSPTAAAQSLSICEGESITVGSNQYTVAGVYTDVFIGSNGCDSTLTTTLEVNPIPAAPEAGSNSPVLAGTAINLTATEVAGATYSWTGPNGYASSDQNPTIDPAGLDDAGEYSVTVTVDGCESEAATILVEVNDTTPTSIQELELKNIYDAIIAPNPFRYNTQLAFTLNEGARCIISVTDLAGREISKAIYFAGQGKNVVTVGENLVSGTYLLSIDTGKEMLTMKMMVLK